MDHPTTIMSLLALLQAVLGVVSGNVSSTKKDNAVKILGSISDLVASGVEINLALDLLTERVKTGVPFTEEELSEFKRRSDAASELIQNS